MKVIYYLHFLPIIATLLSSNVFAYEAEINRMSVVIATKISSSNKLAVVDFTDLNGNVTELGRFISEEMSVALADISTDLVIVDRTHLKSIIKEHKLSSTGIINPDTARELGKISGVDALITGSLTPFDEKVRIIVKVLNTNTAKIIGTVDGNIAKTKGIENLLASDIARHPEPNKNTKKQKNKKMQSFKTTNNHVKEVEGFEFRLRTCKATGSTLICSFMVNNQKADRPLRLWGNRSDQTRIINKNGDEFKSTNVQLGSYSATKYTDRKIIPKDIPIKASVTYQTSKNTFLLSLVEVAIEISNNLNFTVQFRNVEVERQ